MVADILLIVAGLLVALALAFWVGYEVCQAQANRDVIEASLYWSLKDREGEE